jgi:hypothetical protein
MSAIVQANGIIMMTYSSGSQDVSGHERLAL